MLNPKLQKLAGYKAKVEALEKSLRAERDAVLRRLHDEVGFATREELITALRGLKGGPKGRPAAAKGSKGRKKRAKITPEIRDSIVAAAKAGETGNAIAAKFGVSLPSVQNIKRGAGLTKKRKGKK